MQSYDPARFGQEFPDDAPFRATVKAAFELAASIAPPQTGEAPQPAREGIEEKFKALERAVENQLDDFLLRELRATKQQFIEGGIAQIEAKYQPGINRTPVLEQKSGGQFARDEESRQFQQNINTNPDLKVALQNVSEKHAARSVAVSHAIGRVQDACLQAHGLDRVTEAAPELKPQHDNLATIEKNAIGSEEFKAALQREKAEIDRMRRDEMLIPRDFKLNR